MIDSYIPDANTPVKTVLININVFQKNDGSANWQNNPEHISRLNQIVAWMNDYFAHNRQPSDPIAGVPFISDTKIRVELAGIFFYQNDALWSIGIGGSIIMDYLASNYPERLNAININITGGEYIGAAGYATGASWNTNALNYIVTFNNEANPVSDYAFAGHLVHEINHCFDLYHTYGVSCCPETCNSNDIDFLADVFDINAPNWCGTTTCSVCYHQAGWSCDPFDPSNYCTNNTMGGTQAAGYYSPKQMGKVHRALSLKSCRKYVKSNCYTAIPKLITQNETWDFNTRIYSDIIVKTGATLTLSCKLYMPPTSKIIVERGAKLIVNNGLISDIANQMWEGIVVLGNSDQPPWYSKQGYVKLNGATIQNAKCGVKTVYGYGNPANDGLSGGLIHAINSNFINNITAMEFAPYSRVYNTYQIGAFNCNFTTNGALANPAYKPDAFIKLNGVQGIQIAGNKFEATNVQIDYASTKDQYTGILSTNSQYTVFPYKLNNVVVSTNRFIGLKRGIKALHTNSLNFVTVDGAEFNNTFMGMYLSGNTNSVITSNTFIIPQTLELINEPYGLYLDNSTGYHVEANSFTGLVKNGNYGIVVNNSGSVINEVYRNTFSNLSHGIYAQKNNRGDDEYNGLKLLCNTFSNTDVNITVPQTNASPDGISIFQGLDFDPNKTGRNLFSHTQLDYSNWARHLVYFHLNRADHTPNPYEGNITLVPVYGSEGECPSKLETGGGSGSETELKDKIADENTAIDQHENALNAWVDGGNTEILQTDVALSAPWQALQLRDELLSKSPYLSDNVMTEAIQNEDALPAVMLKQVMVANPHAAKSENVMNELENRSNPIPGYMKHEIEQGKNRISAKELLEAKLSAHLTSKAFAVNSLIRLYESDTTGNDSLLALLASQNQPDYQYQLLWKHIAAGNISQAQVTIARLNNSNLSQAEQLELTDLNDYLAVVTAVANSGRNMQQLTPQEISTIAALAAHDHTRAAMYCKNILLAVDENYAYKEPIIKAQSGSNARINNSKQEQTDILNTKVAVYPNPANEYLIVEYQLEQNESENLLSIYDAAGKVIYTLVITDSQNQLLLDTRNYKTGIYTCIFSMNGKTISTAKFNIVR